MPKLYHNGEQEGWQIPGQQDRKAARIDIPSAPAELAAWLNHRRVGPTGLGARTEEELQLSSAIAEDRPWVLGPATKEPPRVRPAFLGDLESGAEFIPVTKAADIDRTFKQCPVCHDTEARALYRLDRLDYESVRSWIDEKAVDLELDDLADLIAGKRQ